MKILLVNRMFRPIKKEAKTPKHKIPDASSVDALAWIPYRNKVFMERKFCYFANGKFAKIIIQFCLLLHFSSPMQCRVVNTTSTGQPYLTPFSIYSTLPDLRELGHCQQNYRATIQWFNINGICAKICF